jgi:transposase
MGTGYDTKNYAHVDKKAWIYSKKKQVTYVEANEAEQQEFIEKIKNIDQKRLRFLDETGMDDNEVNSRAYAPKGQRAFCKKKGTRKHRVSIIATLKENKLRTPFIFERSCDRTTFEFFLEQCVVPDLVPNEIVVMDNHPVHKGGRIKEIIENAQCEILYLPKRSPELNPIEHFWSPLKYRLRYLLEYVTPDIYKAAIIHFSNMST